MVVWGDLTNSWEEKLKVKEKMKDILIQMQTSKEQQGNKKAFLSNQCKEIEGNNRMGKSRDLFKKIIEIPREHFMQRWAQ